MAREIWEKTKVRFVNRGVNCCGRIPEEDENNQLRRINLTPPGTDNEQFKKIGLLFFCVVFGKVV